MLVLEKGANFEYFQLMTSQTTFNSSHSISIGLATVVDVCFIAKVWVNIPILKKMHALGLKCGRPKQYAISSYDFLCLL